MANRRVNFDCRKQGCSAAARSKGYCDKHYMEARRHGELAAPRCEVPSCTEVVFGHGLCVNHYQKKRRLEKRRELLDESTSVDAHLTKECCKCRETKPHPEFYKRRSVASGRSSWCRICTRANKIVKAYGVSWDEAVGLASKRTCASCLDEITKDKLTTVDHCHRTGAVRDVLCHPCNAALGLLREDPNRIKALAEYAVRWNLKLGG